MYHRENNVTILGFKACWFVVMKTYTFRILVFLVSYKMFYELFFTQKIHQKVTGIFIK
jgi:hypothetical protein